MTTPAEQGIQAAKADNQAAFIQDKIKWDVIAVSRKTGIIKVIEAGELSWLQADDKVKALVADYGVKNHSFIAVAANTRKIGETFLQKQSR